VLLADACFASSDNFRSRRATSSCDDLQTINLLVPLQVRLLQRLALLIVLARLIVKRLREVIDFAGEFSLLAMSFVIVLSLQIEIILQVFVRLLNLLDLAGQPGPLALDGVEIVGLLLKVRLKAASLFGKLVFSSRSGVHLLLNNLKILYIFMSFFLELLDLAGQYGLLLLDGVEVRRLLLRHRF
jgi:uncharacterized membrane protein YhaH (DUF805 family)